jgi:ABC-2 type transport system permease protein
MTPTTRVSLIQYLGIWLAFAKNSLIRQLEFKVNLLGRFMTEFIWLGGQLLFFKAIFLQVPLFAGWTETEIYFFVGSLYLVDGAFMFLLSENQNHFGDLVRNGLFDFYLLRPLSAFFMACFRHLNLSGIVNISAGLSLSVWALQRGELELSAEQLAIWLVYLTVGFGLLVCLLMSVCCLAFWITQTRNLNWLFFELYRLGWRPENLYPTVDPSISVGRLPRRISCFGPCSARTRQAQRALVCLPLDMGPRRCVASPNNLEQGPRPLRGSPQLGLLTAPSPSPTFSRVNTCAQVVKLVDTPS